MSVRETIVEVFTEVAQEQKRPIPPLADSTPLLELGLDSLATAVIITRLEDRLGTDPFSTGEAMAPPRTFGEFVALYARAAVA
jgi:aryl carrier-like protein